MLVPEVDGPGEFEGLGDRPELSVVLAGLDTGRERTPSGRATRLIAMGGAAGGTGRVIMPLSLLLKVQFSCLAAHCPQGWPVSSHLTRRLLHVSHPFRDFVWVRREGMADVMPA